MVKLDYKWKKTMRALISAANKNGMSFQDIRKEIDEIIQDIVESNAIDTYFRWKWIIMCRRRMKIKINIETELYNKLARTVEDSKFKTVDEYVGYILVQIVSNLKEGEEPYPMSEELKRRFQHHGYALGE